MSVVSEMCSILYGEVFVFNDNLKAFTLFKNELLILFRWDFV